MIGQLFLGRYETQKLLGEGGMGKVYLARQNDLGRQVVVKVMHDHIAADAKFRDRFKRETELMARFQHPNAVTLYDASLSDPNGLCIVMEYVKGVNLEKLLRDNKRLNAGRVGRIVSQLADVLQAAHDEGIIHRDLKPANLMITDPDTPRERVKVMDFGLAKRIDEGTERRVTDTTVDFAVGTPGYICPEQVRGESMDHRGDLYSVGVMLYELLTGRLPYVGTTSMDVLLAHATEDAPPMDEVCPGVGVPPAVETLVMDLLAKDPSDRPQSAREMGARFATALERSRSVSAAAVMSAASRPIPIFAGVGHAGTDSDPIVLTPSREEITLPTLAEADFPILPSKPAAMATAPALKPPTAPADSACLPFTMDAWMPESIAVMKLRGFSHDCDGEILESRPGLVRLRLGRDKNASGAFSWFGISRKAADGPLNCELHLNRTDPARENKLSITVRFRPSHPQLLSDDLWRRRCTALFVQLRAYLMGAPA
jgi:eukaryotic-like serine/threonine-protein kinase